MYKMKSLVASIVAIISSFSMLLGTTFAWFTDSTSSNGNVIKSGNLDVNAYWMEANQDPLDSANWVEFNGDPIFNYDKWEPGFVDAKHVKVVNGGSLAFKYKLAILPNGDVSALANVIDVYFFTSATKLNARSDVENGINVGTLADLIADPDGAAYGILLPLGATPNSAYEVVGEVAVTIAFKMKNSLKNEYQNMAIGNNFDLVIYATQYEYEEDIFGSDYDKDSEYKKLPSKWNGTADTSWYNDTDVEFTLTSDLLPL